MMLWRTSDSIAFEQQRLLSSFVVVDIVLPVVGAIVALNKETCAGRRQHQRFVIVLTHSFSFDETNNLPQR